MTVHGFGINRTLTEERPGARLASAAARADGSKAGLIDRDKDDLIADGLASIDESTAFLSISRSTLYGLMDRGLLAWVKIGRARRVPRRALVALAKANLCGGHAAE